MARKEALLRLHKFLVVRRDELRNRLGGELQDLRLYKSLEGGDAADLAFDTGSEEVNSQLAQLEGRELFQIDRALSKLKKGTYGHCESCEKKIPVARLNALPYSVMCIECQREMEMYGGWGGRGNLADWEKITEGARPIEEQREINLADIEMDFSASR